MNLRTKHCGELSPMHKAQIKHLLYQHLLAILKVNAQNEWQHLDDQHGLKQALRPPTLGTRPTGVVSTLDAPSVCFV